MLSALTNGTRLSKVNRVVILVSAFVLLVACRPRPV